jgi:hypothetical protein
MPLAAMEQGNRNASSPSTVASKTALAGGIPDHVRSVTLLLVNDQRPLVLVSLGAPAGREAAPPARGAQSGWANRHAGAGGLGSRVR